MGYTQSDMRNRVGMSRQQYPRLEAKGNPRLDTLELIAKGLKSELVLVPDEMRASVAAFLTGDTPSKVREGVPEMISDDPWKSFWDSSE